MAPSNPSTAGLPPASIAIDRLQYPSSIIAPNVWGLQKEQPAYFNIRINLRQSFETASSKDVLDESTIHYGDLAKRIRAACTPGLGPLDALSEAGKVIRVMGMKSNGRYIVADAHIDLCLPKASMYGRLLQLNRWLEFNHSGDTTDSGFLFQLQDLRLMSLIGVNDYERTGKQPVDVTLAVKIWDGGKEDIFTVQHLAYLFTMEGTLANVVEESSFETLESLGDFVAKLFIGEFDHQFFSDAAEIRLRLEKPKAIPFAGAAVVEIRRTHREERHVTETQAAKSGPTKRLSILKPYIEHTTKLE